ncbi:MAG: FadR family transcriptional regulator [Actinobacteria bacterium]|nr:FadR family transcriptional regulator [Actinomycetota bacterium]
MSLKNEGKRTRTYRVIVSEIQELIKQGGLAPGDQLLPERQLAEKLGVSRPTLREALTALEAMGIIEVSPGGGAYVKEVNLDAVVQSLAMTMAKEQQDIYHLVELRRILEIQTVRLAAVRAQETDLFRIRENAVQMQRDVEAGRPADESDVSFHFHIADAAQNPMITNVMTMLAGLMREAYGPSRKKLLGDHDKAQLFCDQHRRIYQAIRDRDPDAAERAMTEHFQSIEEILFGLQKANGPGKAN